MDIIPFRRVPKLRMTSLAFGSSFEIFTCRVAFNATCGLMLSIEGKYIVIDLASNKMYVAMLAELKQVIHKSVSEAAMLTPADQVQAPGASVAGIESPSSVSQAKVALDRLTSLRPAVIIAGRKFIPL